MDLHKVKPVAEWILSQLQPHCHRIEIAGSIRREAPNVNDIEILCIPKPQADDLPHIWHPGFTAQVDAWLRLSGNARIGKAFKRNLIATMLPEDIAWPTGNKYVKVDIFTARPDNWGLQLVIRTGSAYFSKKMASSWSSQGYFSENATLTRRFDKRTFAIPEEKDLFNLLGLPYVEPVKRDIRW